MVAWQIWLIIAGICLVIEILTVGFLVFWFALAAGITAIFSIFVDNIIAQTAIFVILSIIFIACTRKFANKLAKKDNTITNAKTVVGKEGVVKKEISSTKFGQVKIEGDLWTAKLDDNCKDSIPEGSLVNVLDIDGVKVVVEPKIAPEP